MARTTAPLTVDHLAELPGGCGSCVFWELDPVRRERVTADDGLQQKQAWLARVLRDWGTCGRVVLVDGRVVGHAVYAPAAYLPGADGFPTAPVSADAVLLAAAYVDPRHRGGLGRLLVQGVAHDLVDRGSIRGVEAFGRPAGRVPGATASAAAGCLLPVGFLDSVGFTTQRAHPTTPRLRLDLRSSLTWRDEVEAAVERLVGAVRPVNAPRPTRACRVGREG